LPTLEKAASELLQIPISDTPIGTVRTLSPHTHLSLSISLVRSLLAHPSFGRARRGDDCADDEPDISAQAENETRR
jgi:hypothetical protein